MRKLFSASPFLMLTTVVMAVDLLACLFALFIDHTIITGVPAWIKPLKFAIATGIYSLSAAVIICYTPIWKKALWVVDLLSGLALTMEIVLIDLQAARHTTSHFNISTPFDASVFIAMGSGIGVVWMCAIVLTVAAFRTRYAPPIWTVVVRYGMLLTVLGMGTGALMTVPPHDRLAAAKTAPDMPISGSHTLGGPDGGPGLPFTNWSTEHGDLRAPHFLGLHALQLLALIAFVLERSRVPAQRAVRIVSVAAASYACLFLITLAEALSWRPITSHGTIALAVWSVWLAISAAGLLFATRRSVALTLH